MELEKYKINWQLNYSLSSVNKIDKGNSCMYVLEGLCTVFRFEKKHYILKSSFAINKHVGKKIMWKIPDVNAEIVQKTKPCTFYQLVLKWTVSLKNKALFLQFHYSYFYIMFQCKDNESISLKLVLGSNN